jgi:NAD(P)-dependent dehydrogenase (short-subunit alcohol dehydrogenase family)
MGSLGNRRGREWHKAHDGSYVFLASPQMSSYITGEILPIIGGYGGG